MDEIDQLIAEAGQTHVIPPRENENLLRRLADPRVFQRARELLLDDASERRRAAIICIERIAYVLHDQETAEVLLEHADRATDKFEVMTTLMALARCTPPRPLPSRPLLRLVRRHEWQVWAWAVQCLHLARADEVEQALLERRSERKEGLVFVARELKYFQSAESLRVLVELLSHPSVDVRTVALSSLGDRLDAGVLPHARRLAAGWQWQVKYAALGWIAKFGDESDVGFMSGRLRGLVTKGRKFECEPPEISFLLPFLLRFEGADEAETVLRLLRDRFPGSLPKNERSWIETYAAEVIEPRAN